MHSSGARRQKARQASLRDGRAGTRDGRSLARPDTAGTLAVGRLSRLRRARSCMTTVLRPEFSSGEFRKSSPTGAPATPVPAGPRRLDHVDLLRGLVMVLMVLDHVRDYFTAVRFDPTDLTHTNLALFATRWITHYCAPVFVFLAGASAWMAGTRRTRGELARFLLSRGVWLILVEVTVVSFAWYLSTRWSFGARAQVIWAIGASMVVL